MNKKRRLLTFAVCLFVLCSFVSTALPAYAATGQHTELLARASTIESALDEAFARRADELYTLASEYLSGAKIPTDESGAALDAVEEAYRLRTLATHVSTISYDSYALAIVENAYEKSYVGSYRSIETLADDMTALYVTVFRTELLTTPELVSDALTIAYMRAVGDKYASYFNEDEYAEHMSDSQAQYGGIGVTVTQLEDGYVEVLSVTPSSPAEAAGILLGDVIIGVNGDDFVEIGYSTAINRIRGKAGESVTVTICRGDEIFDKTIVRATLTEYSVSYKMLSLGDGKIGYVRIGQFDEGTFEQFVEAVDTLGSLGAEKFVFDVRNNLGGRLEAVLAVLEYILPDSELPLIRMEYKSETISYKSALEYLRDNESDTETIKKYQKAKNHQIDSPMVVLCNSFTASAGELFTSCLKDYGAAKIYGEKTYGKGMGQTGSILTDYFSYAEYGVSYYSYYRKAIYNLSTFYYSPPISDNYEGKGISPDVVVSLSEEAAAINFYKLTEQMDDQLKAAVDYLETTEGSPYDPSVGSNNDSDLGVYRIVFWIGFGVLAAVTVSLCVFFVVMLVKEKKRRDAFFGEDTAKDRESDKNAN